MRRRRLLLPIVSALVLLPSAAWAQFPGENGVIAFGRLSSAADGIATIAAPGDAPTMLFESKGFARSPSYSPDGSRIAFMRSADVWVMSADGTGARRLTGGRVVESCPRWSPDGSTIVYDRGGDLWTVDADAPDPSRIARTRADEYCPSWSPDGSTIAFVLNGLGPLNFDLALMDPDGTDRRRITADARAQFAPDWSPDGTTIVYNHYTAFDIAKIFTIEPDGTDRTLIYGGAPLGAYDPVFSPDGLSIAFTRDHRGRAARDIWVVGADGSDPIRATTGPAFDTTPGWQPLLP